MAKPFNLKLLTLICATTLLMSCSEPKSQPTTGVTADQSEAPASLGPIREHVSTCRPGGA